MNIFRILADLSHVISIIIILVKIHRQRSCAGLSLKSQELYALVFATRYLDLFFNFTANWYNSVLKIVFLATSFAVVFLMRKKYKSTYQRESDTFNQLYLIVPCFALSTVVNLAFTPTEILWAFSIYLEAVAILPQLFMLQKRGECETITSHYIFFLGSYRALYILNWVYRAFTEDKYRMWLVWVAGIVQTVIYCDFFYHYMKSVLNNKRMILPA